MKITELADQVRNTPLREVLARYGFEPSLKVRRSPRRTTVTTSSHGPPVVDNKAGLAGGGAIDLVIRLAKFNFSVASRPLANEFLPLASGQTMLSFPWQEPSHPEKKSFEERAAIYAVRDDSNWPIARNYLIEQRKISPNSWTL
jgi:hypothetical protein